MYTIELLTVLNYVISNKDTYPNTDPNQPIRRLTYEKSNFHDKFFSSIFQLLLLITFINRTDIFLVYYCTTCVHCRHLYSASSSATTQKRSWCRFVNISIVYIRWPSRRKISQP